MFPLRTIHGCVFTSYADVYCMANSCGNAWSLFNGTGLLQCGYLLCPNCLETITSRMVCIDETYNVFVLKKRHTRFFFFTKVWLHVVVVVIWAVAAAVLVVVIYYPRWWNWWIWNLCWCTTRWHSSTLSFHHHSWLLLEISNWWEREEDLGFTVRPRRSRRIGPLRSRLCWWYCTTMKYSLSSSRIAR